MNEDFIIDIQLTNSAGAAFELANVIIDTVFYTNGRQRYRFFSGMTDAQGRLRVTFDLLESERIKNQSFSIMDYNTKLQECDSRISFIVPSLKELQEFEAAIIKWFPENVTQLENIKKSNNAKLICNEMAIDVTQGTHKVYLTCGLNG